MPETAGQFSSPEPDMRPQKKRKEERGKEHFKSPLTLFVGAVASTTISSSSMYEKSRPS